MKSPMRSEIVTRDLEFLDLLLNSGKNREVCDIFGKKFVVEEVAKDRAGGVAVLVEVNEVEDREESWTGAGLPPVGTVCEMWHEKIGDWLKSEVAFVGEQILVVRYHSIAHGHHEAAIMNVDSEKLLRLPRTPEQIAAEERERAISEMLRIYTDGAPGHCGGIAALYDAGYRRQEPKE